MIRRLLTPLIAAMVAAAAASSVPAQVPNDADTLALAATIDNNSFDRAQLMNGNQLQFWSPVFDTLLTREPNGDIGPNLATSWSYNSDNSVLTLILREGVHFIDGSPFDGEAVKANLEYLRNGSGQNSFMAASISEIEIVAPNEVRLHLLELDPGLLENLAVVGGAMAAPATLGVEGSQWHPIGSGPYLYDAQRSVPGVQYVYIRNPQYWNAAAFPFAHVTITPVNDHVARLEALKSGQIDAGLSQADAIADAVDSGLVVNQSDVNWFGFIMADREGRIVPALSDARVRRAIKMAFDSAAILESVERGHGRLTDQIFPVGSDAYLPELDDVYSYNLATARSLLADAGYAQGFDIVLPDIAGFAVYNPIIEKSLGDIGITVTWETVAPDATIGELRSGRFPAYIFQFGYQGDWAEFRRFGYPDSPWNVSRVADPDFLQLLDEAQYATGDQQIALFQEMNRYMVDNAFFAPLYRRETIYLTNSQTVVEMQSTNVVPPIRNYAKAG